MTNIKRGIVLMNLGSPDAPSVKDVKRYLDEFLMDERVLDIPFWKRFLLVKGIIVPFRAPNSAHAYQQIWTKEGSPLIVLTEQLRDALQQHLDEPMAIAMRYGHPTPKAAFDELLKDHPELEEVLLFPLYPHYAMSSYETAAEYARTIHEKEGYQFALNVYPVFYNDERYIEALADSLQPFVQDDFDQLIFSYHGIPERHILKGDCTGTHCLKTEDCCSKPSPAHQQCYRHQCFTTTRLAAEKLAIPREKYSVSFQSRLGRDEWLKPYTVERLQNLPKEGIKKLVIVCPAFISDCLETLEEIAQEGRDIFMKSGGVSFQLVPCLNVRPKWVETLAGMIKS